MNHVAIMKKSWGLTEKILSGEKELESRWYKTKRSPWGVIQKGDTVYFKNSGEPVTLKTTVKQVLSFSDLTPQKVKEILQKHAKATGISPNDEPKFFKLFKDKKYCLLIFLSNVKKIKPFDIDKSGFGAMAAWLVVNAIRTIQR